MVIGIKFAIYRYSTELYRWLNGLQTFGHLASDEQWQRVLTSSSLFVMETMIHSHIQRFITANIASFEYKERR